MCLLLYGKKPYGLFGQPNSIFRVTQPSPKHILEYFSSFQKKIILNVYDTINMCFIKLIAKPVPLSREVTSVWEETAQSMESVPGLMPQPWIPTPVLQFPRCLIPGRSLWGAARITWEHTWKAFNAMANTRQLFSSFLSIFCPPPSGRKVYKKLRPFWFIDASSANS